MKKLSIITAIHGQIEYNKVFFDSLMRSTTHPFELIVVDNASQDGSADFFEQNGAMVLRNTGNLCYGCSQNQGLARATGEYAAFLNNDIVLSAGWDAALIGYLEDYGLDAISPCGIETMESEEATRAFMRRWRRVNAVQRLRAAAGIPYTAKDLRLLLRLMYGNWDRFTEKRRKEFDRFLYPGISGNAVLLKRRLFETIGPWSIATAAADWDLQLRLVKAQSETGAVRQCMVAGGVFVHHFIRATFRAKPKMRGCSHPLADITACYAEKDLSYLRRPKVSVIIAVHNRPDFLEKVFISLSNQSHSDFEVVVSDDGSGPEIEKLVDAWQGRFRYAISHVRQEHRGFRKTIVANRSVVRSRSDYLCFIDGDCVLHHRFLEDHFRCRKTGTVLSGRRVMLDEELTARLGAADVETGRIEKPAFWSGHAEGASGRHGFRLPAVSAVEDGWRTARGRNYCILGSNFSLFKGDFYRVNGYEEAITGRGLEDNNLSNRLKRANIRIRTLARRAIQYHLHHTSAPIPHGRETIERWGAPENFWAEKGIM